MEIGEVLYKTSISIDPLSYYDKIGILTPKKAKLGATIQKRNWRLQGILLH